MGYHSSWKNNNYNSYRSDSENSCQEQQWKKTYFVKEKESYIVPASEIDSANELPRDIVSFTNELQQVIHDVDKRSIGNVIETKSAQIYFHKVIQRVNREKE